MQRVTVVVLLVHGQISIVESASEWRQPARGRTRGGVRPRCARSRGRRRCRRSHGSRRRRRLWVMSCACAAGRDPSRCHSRSPGHRTPVGAGGDAAPRAGAGLTPASATPPACPAVHCRRRRARPAVMERRGAARTMSVAEAADDLRLSGATGASGSSVAEAVIVSVAHGATRAVRCGMGTPPPARRRGRRRSGAAGSARRPDHCDDARPPPGATAAQVGRAVDDAFDVIADGPEVPGLWSVDVSVAAVTRLVTAAAWSSSSPPTPGSARSMLRSGRLGGPVAESTVAGDGPLARRSDGALVTRPFRSGGVVVIGPPGVGKTALLKAVLVLVSWRDRRLHQQTVGPPGRRGHPSRRLRGLDGTPSARPCCTRWCNPFASISSPSAHLAADLRCCRRSDGRGENPDGSGGRDRFFLDHAERLAGALLWWAKLQGHDAATAAGALFSDLGRVTVSSAPSGGAAKPSTSCAPSRASPTSPGAGSSPRPPRS